VKHIGIVGCSAEGAALCYRTICLEAEPLMGRHNHPEVTLHTFPLASYMAGIETGNLQQAAELMLRAADALKRAGADFLICPDNTMHQAMPHVLPRSPLPWLHIAEEVGKVARRRGFRNLGLTGTKFLVRGPVYEQKFAHLGLGLVRPVSVHQDRINDIIFDELVRGQRLIPSLFYFQQVIEDLKNRGCDAVILGCTELPLLVGDEETVLPALDSTRILARAALQCALA
jgi:aspartate racemase